jgi:hypothetical protein
MESSVIYRCIASPALGGLVLCSKLLKDLFARVNSLARYFGTSLMDVLTGVCLYTVVFPQIDDKLINKFIIVFFKLPSGKLVLNEEIN